MAAASRQPEMAELPAAALHGNSVSTSPAEGVVGASDNQASDGQGRPVSTTAHDAHPLSTTPESGHPAMHTVATTGNNEDDDIDGVRGADSGLAASTNGDNATITSRRSEEALKSIPTTQPPVVTTSEPLAVNKDVASTAMPSLGSGPRDGQEQGDQVTLELLLLSGSRKRFYFSSSATINEVLAWIFKDWPTEWEEQRPQDLSQLRLLHRGQFLQGSSKLSAHQVEDSSVTVMHLNIRPVERAESIKPKRTKTSSNKAATTTTDTHEGGCCSSCIIS